ncbi:DUF4232 domain-containing protein [Streptomyces xiamenensis]|uniref:DUF4232 domain-containing protein n=1 Tax=Streptomyces TaxID=1883 RepID=UPI000693496C|nr:DUF4232 domain-containing protein [Streptomyces sp. NRRL F-2890]
MAHPARRTARRPAAVLARWALPVALAALALAGCGTQTAPPETDADAAAPPRPPSPEPERPDCPESGVRVTEDGGDAAMGLRVMGLRLTNCGTEPYELNGYPTVAVLDEDGDPYDIKVLHGTGDITASLTGFDDPPAPLTLQPGEHALSGLVWRNTVDDPSRTVANGERLSVRPADGVAAQRLAPTYPVDLGTTGVLGISPWHAPQEP